MKLPVLLGIAVTGMASAQDPISPWLRYNVGKVVILPNASLANMFTDNLFSLASPNRVADVMTTVTPGLRLKWDENAAIDASVEYHHGETFIWDHSDFNSHSDNVEAKVSYAGPKLKVSGTGTFVDSVSLGSGAFNLGRQLLKTTRYGGGVQTTYDWTPKTDISSGLQYSSSTFGNGNLSNQQGVDGNLGTSYEMTSKYRLTLEARGGWTEAQSSFISSGGLDSYAYGGRAGVRGSFTPKLSGSAQVGYEVRQYSSGDSASASTPAFTVALTYQLSPMTSMTLSYDRRTSLAVWGQGQLTIQDAVQFQVRQSLGASRRWVGLFSGQFSNGDYKSAVAGSNLLGTNPGMKDQRLGATLSLQYIPQSWLSVVGAYSFDFYEVEFDDSRNSLFVSARNYHANRVSLSANIGF